MLVVLYTSSTLTLIWPNPGVQSKNLAKAFGNEPFIRSDVPELKEN